MTPLIVIFGAQVRPDGRPSASLARRIGYGLEAARAWPDAPILCSGGGAPSEAGVMARSLIEAGVAPGRLILDEASRNTRQNVLAAVAQVRAGGHPYILACTDAYHLLRVRLLLAAHGVKSRGAIGRERPPLGDALVMALREAVAIPHNLARVMARRGRRTS